MALGGGSFTSQNKELPGAYINFVSAASASAALSDRGIATMPLELDWGADDGIFEVTSEDFRRNCQKIFGYPYDHAKMKGLRDLFLGAKTLYAYRLNGGGGKAANTFASAKYSGIRGNDLKTVIQANADDSTKFDVMTYMGTVKVDEQTVADRRDYRSLVDAWTDGINTFDTFQDGWVADAFDAGASWGDGIADQISNFDLSELLGLNSQDKDDKPDWDGIADSLNGICEDTGNISDALDVTDEDLKYLRDLAEQETVNRYTVAEVSIDMSGMQNTVNGEGGFDGFVSDLTDAVNEAVDSITEGVHE